MNSIVSSGNLEKSGSIDGSSLNPAIPVGMTAASVPPTAVISASPFLMWLAAEKKQ